MDELAYDLISHLHEPGTQAVLVRILDCVPGPPTPTIEQGTLRCRIEDVIRGKPGKPGKPGDTLSVRYRRRANPDARPYASINYWNLLPLAPGDLLVLVGRPADGSGWQALSGNQVAAADDEAVVGLREACRIEDLPANAESARRQALLAALIGVNPLVRHYAIEALCRREVVPRETGGDLLIRALASDAIDDETRLRLANALSSAPIFDEARGNDETNRRTLTALAATLGQVSDMKARKQVVRYFASCVLNDFAAEPAQNRQTRATLLHAISPTPPAPMAAMLADMAQSPDPDDQAIAQDVRAAWNAQA